MSVRLNDLNPHYDSPEAIHGGKVVSLATRRELTVIQRLNREQLRKEEERKATAAYRRECIIEASGIVVAVVVFVFALSFLGIPVWVR